MQQSIAIGLDVIAVEFFLHFLRDEKFFKKSFCFNEHKVQAM
ncbi:MAG: hypothetical protein BROFUL_01947 [Candidatus Brocadia fulgida]|uniref:Uncharacterized protein n=1 Tax=Candidatus Brocadia fulgida TaxID=380242 RepID=A0A0M2UTF3_9BACT|nr:MAG: hypothetical protein BROFUL_01947 [Candidatus Brocadia fulgida]MBV6519432.1 hypothetical protein [Candidatus Brocadia fulgida]